MFSDKKKTPPHQASMSDHHGNHLFKTRLLLKKHLEETKLELDSVVFRPQNDNISANERKAIFSLKHNSEINLKKADKGTTTRKF